MNKESDLGLLFGCPRYSPFRKFIRTVLVLSCIVMSFLLFFETPMETDATLDDGAFDLVSGPTNHTFKEYAIVEKDDESYIGNAIHYKTSQRYTTIGSHDEALTKGVCLFTQLSLDRLDTLVELASSWQNYMSVALYIQDSQDSNKLHHSLERITTILSKNLSSSARIDISLLYGYQLSAPQSLKHHPYDLLYPINALRNLAMRGCQSEYVFSLDVDFITAQNAHTSIISHLERLETARQTDTRLALVVPVFEWIFPREPMPMPMNLDQLRTYCSRNRLIPFHSKRLDRSRYTPQDLKDWCNGQTETPKHIKITRVQNLTDYSQWLRADHVYPIQKNPRILDMYYEPYFIARKETMPEFSERFRGYGFNKRANAMAMQYAHFRFEVLQHVFAVHRYHPSSSWKSKLKSEEIIAKTLERTFDAYKRELIRNKKKSPHFKN